MVTKKDVIESELIKEIITIRLDTLWKMIEMKQRGVLPGVNEEGATGRLDNKGAIFIPGGLVHQDVDGAQIAYERVTEMSSDVFREKIHVAMHFDNATLLHPDGIAIGVNLDSGFFSRTARRIFNYKKAAFRRKKKIGPKLPQDIKSDHIIRSHNPPYIQPPYGARTRISTCASVGLIDPPMYFAYCKTEFNLSERRAAAFASRLDMAQDRVRAKDGVVLYPPYVIVCHDTRYKENSYTGLTRILGIDKFGAFATFTLERVDQVLAAELKRKRKELLPENIFAQTDEAQFVGVIRIYAPTSMGRRSSKYDLYLLCPDKDLGLDVKQAEQRARQHYWG